MLLYYEIGRCAFACMLVMCIFLYTFHWVGEEVGISRLELVKHTEDRLKVTNQAILGIRFGRHQC